jgi:nucleoside-diphosphate-sugar epimerase
VVKDRAVHRKAGWLMNGRCLVTGASGFIGSALLREFRRRGLPALGASRLAEQESEWAIGEIDGVTEWRSALDGVQCVVHTAGRAHVLRDAEADPLGAFRRVNVEGTWRLATQAAETGVRRLVFISSIGVNGISTNGRGPFTSRDVPAPIEPYGQSKLEAELVLQEIAASTELEVVIVRPPLVYGPGVRANFLRLVKLVQRGWPLPLGGVDNRRSLVALDNLVDMLICCTAHPAAAGETFLVSDNDDLSTPDLLGRVGAALGMPVRLVPMPRWLLLQGARLIGRRGEAERLLGSLQVDIRHTRELLGWEPPISVDEGIRRAVGPLC